MMFSVKRVMCAGALLLALLALPGCLPTSSTQVDEEKEPHFLEGKSRINSMDFAGAVESFERALEANPRSASAHFELGWLCDQHDSDPAAAIYHYARYLKLHPDGEKADRAKSRINACKQELARTVALGPIAQNLQRDFDQVADENKRLKDELEKWQAYYKTARPPAQTNGASLVQARPVQPLVMLSDSTGPTLRSDSVPRTGTPATNRSATRTHTVKSGETPAAIARKYGIKVDALAAANPKLDARRMQIGQVLNIPAP
ncbi:MAG TPA: LysM peptidoglycan-binding domain-containing protein [Candidatus Dormibacteraeota bacterium]|nr:LysM peptidoglycan-binding domain-containing protein [Candidatus Dormibacteraeota bacterium]